MQYQKLTIKITRLTDAFNDAQIEYLKSFITVFKNYGLVVKLYAYANKYENWEYWNKLK